jgi:hypothetical protein
MANSGSCESLDGQTWQALDHALFRVGSSLAKTLGSLKRPAEATARDLAQWFTDKGLWPRTGGDTAEERHLGASRHKLIQRRPDLCVKYGIPEILDKAEIMRRARGKKQFVSFAEFVVHCVTTSRLEVKTAPAENSILVNNIRGFERELADRCCVRSLAHLRAELMAGCWEFVLDGKSTTDTRSWSELVAASDYVRVVGARRIAYLDWKDSRLRGGTRWIDPRTGTAAGKSVCPPAVRRPWTPPVPAEPADGT